MPMVRENSHVNCTLLCSGSSRLCPFDKDEQKNDVDGSCLFSFFIVFIDCALTQTTPQTRKCDEFTLCSMRSFFLFYS